MNFSSEEFAVKSRKGNFSFLATEFGNGIAFGRHPFGGANGWQEINIFVYVWIPACAGMTVGRSFDKLRMTEGEGFCAR